MAKDEDEIELLRPGQTVEEWWAEYGLDPETARVQRAARYALQRAETLNKARALAARRMIDVG